MKRMKTNPVLLICFFLFSSALVSCDKDYSLENGIPIDYGDTNQLCKACIYLPWCDSSVYQYIDSSNAGAANKTITLRILSDTIINGISYNYSTLNTDRVYHNCSNGTSTMLSYNNAGAGLISIPLQANQPAGYSWQCIQPGSGTNNIYDYNIIAKSINRNVLGRDFTDVILVHQKLSANFPLFGNVVVSETDLYYAKAIGLIESITIDNSTGNVALHRVLQQYYIP
jgi:hypothetical protein